MQKVKIPRTVDPAKAAQKRLDYDGIIQQSLLKRLEESVAGVKRDAHVSLSFGMDEQQLVVISGKANIEVDLECQRCNELFAHECEVEFTYTPYYSEKSEQDAPDEYDLVDLNEYGEVDLIQLVEDEFILNLPQVAMHDEADCRVNSDNLVFGELPEEVLEDKPNPFDVLKSLKK
ncbi:23S rRNA accumulation protein YceD [Vibrio cincinnatiensis]|uniref:23S rRNA accumulation protein YceD n=1 Tax=Vibrio cincinnatiensis TaxID=675 RepID=UPI0012AC81F0|nr:23S rRNA accumulation protein YceD [Vibrio cincinnatiensis]MCG3724676.1 23S rRNA accumulation protein YceD [Vibrio cincinnatiensis]MCG3731678.1 23S rRNA accumulation protein YceD [Vibrio cincinnatiensis]MCG3738338.1 23S rRNA accumulation protein YceD [Vibrio cincinnatiensis]MCG3744411.1 23S rRNA accumulation protein YceD [Vibrio cincinnatiensis]MCG3758959.1 23S rRNA accumulation protein YceD [Vibrio cincinnatiensis]